MTMFDAIFTRKSIRHFSWERLEWDLISDILDFANQLPMLIDGISVEFKLISNIEKKQGFRGPFAIKAPYYLCISSEEKEDYLINAGYLMEQINLYISSKGLGACFLGAANPGFALKKSMKYKYVITLAFGKSSEDLQRDCAEAKRLPESQVAIYKEEVSPEIRQIIKAARLAPSSLNNQPWRFVVYNNRIHVFSRKNNIFSYALDYNKKMDMGIMLANLLITAEELWVETTITKSETIKSKQFQNNEYLCTIVIG